MKEEWRPIHEYECWYEISNKGNVRCLVRRRRTRVNRNLCWRYDSKGYPCIGLSKTGKRVQRKIHSLVAEAFIGPCWPGYQVNHKDGNKRNPFVDNLEYVTPSENARHAIEMGLAVPLSGERHGNAFLTDEQVAQIHYRANAGESLRSLAAEYGCSKSLASQYKNYIGRAASLH